MPHPKVKAGGSSGGSVLYFAITYQAESEAENHKVDGALQTWTKRVPVLWCASGETRKQIKQHVIKYTSVCVLGARRCCFEHAQDATCNQAATGTVASMHYTIDPKQVLEQVR